MTFRSRLIGTSAAVAVLCALAPAAATAGEMTYDPTLGSLTYKATTGEDNVIEASTVAGALTLVDRSTAVIDTSAATLACTPTLDNTVTCTPAAGTALKIDGVDGADTISFAGTEDIKLVGGAGDDVLTGGDGADRLIGDDGADRFVGGAGADRFDGGTGTDVSDYSTRIAPVTATPGTGADDGEAGEGDEVRFDVESALGGSGADVLKAGAAGGTLAGGDGEDVLTGGAGVDAFDAGAGDDRVVADDGLGESVACGTELDAVQVDKLDAVAADCETVKVIVPVEPVVKSDTTPGTTPTTPEKKKVAPKLGKSVVVRTGNGTIKVKGPDGRFVVLAEAGEIPVGSTVDAREGSVTLTAEAQAGGVLQTATFTGAVFTVKQLVDVRPVTELYLRGGSFRGCPRPRARGSLARSSAVARERRVVRSLWGRGHGRFRTVGRHSAASVRGTVWKTVDRCDGTLTRVRRGAVRVADYGRNRHVMVRAGHSYLARARRR